MPLIKMFINKETGGISVFSQYLTIEDYGKLKRIMNEYFKQFDKENKEEK